MFSECLSMIPETPPPSASNWPSQGPIHYRAGHPFNYHRFFLETLGVIRDKSLAICLLPEDVYPSQLFGFR
jgi:hypothetical protein